ncbi:Activating signal cointegrator 1 [Cryptosporidium felis]|nr:Activating signal cointegrator 1 [Cryptosporidium felis]
MVSFRISDVQIQHKKKKKNKKNANSTNGEADLCEDVGAKKPVLECGCYGKLHALYDTCIDCGRISCENEKELLESKGKCLYCNSTLNLNEADEFRTRGYRDEEIAHYLQAVDMRDRLLEFARNSTNRMRVIDEEMDWYSEFENPWNTREERDLALKMSKESCEAIEKRKTMINIDIENKQVTMDEGYKERSTLYYSKLLEEFEQGRGDTSNTTASEGDMNSSNILSMLEQKLKFRDHPKAQGNLGSKSPFKDKSEFFPLSVEDKVWSDQDF